MILVTGATGFVGKALQREMLARKIQARAAMRTLLSDEHQLLNVCAVGDIGPYTDWRVALRDVHAVIHTAGRAHILNDQSIDPLTAFREVNTAGTLQLARQAAEMNVKRFVFLSSIGVNGVESIIPFKESDLVKPTEPYAISKLEAEEGLLEIAKTTNMEVVIIRPPLVYGPNAPGNFARLVDAVRRGLPLPLGSVTRNRRTLVGLDNLVDLVMVCLQHPAAANQVFLAGDGEDVSTADLLRKIALAFHVPSRLMPCPLVLLELVAGAVGKKAMVNRLCGSLQIDIVKSRSLLGWSPPNSLDQGLQKVAAVKTI